MGADPWHAIDGPIFPNIYRNVIPAKPDLVWVADITGFTAEYLGVKLRFDMRFHASEQTEVSGIVSCVQLAPLQVNEKPFLLESFTFESSGRTDIAGDGPAFEMDSCAGPVVATCMQLALARNPITAPVRLVP